MNIRYFDRSENVEVGRNRAVAALKAGGMVAVGYRAKWEDRYASEVEVYGPRKRYGTMSPPEVNWSALGSVSPGEAIAYAALILEAARIAGEAI